MAEKCGTFCFQTRSAVDLQPAKELKEPHKQGKEDASLPYVIEMGRATG